MPLTPGLTANLPVTDDDPRPVFDGADVDLGAPKQTGEVGHYNDRGDLLRLEHEDGSITVTLDGSPLERANSKKALGWYDNLADDIDPMELTRIAEDLLRGIRDDITSRQDWIDTRANGIKLLGLKLELPGLSGAADGAPVEGISRIRHPLLLEAVLRFQANARSEMLPTDGPVKVRDDGNGTTAEEDRLGDALEKDLNHFLTVTAREYYPDTDRMLLMLGFGGTTFKKVYFCPLRNRPVSETVDADDLIVNESATDLTNASRVTHRVNLKASTVKRLQILDVYRDIDLSTPLTASLDAVQLEKKDQQGLTPVVFNPDDRDREIYECYCELDIKGFEHEWNGKVTGLEIPYRVTIDVSSRQILALVRNYEQGEKLPEAENPFVKYTFVPGFGFYDIGLVHILGNTTNAVTAAWRELLDSGMYANFPGFLMSDEGGRQNTNIFRVPPGGGAMVKTGGKPISQAIMPLPYNSQGMGALMSLVQDISTTGMRIGGASEQQVGEGRADAPMGTTLAMIEQAQKVLNAVHKRMHAAQAEEFQKLVQVFKDHPESFWQRNNAPAYRWDEETFLRALTNVNLVPQADPNTASHGQRVMKIMALKQLQAAQPSLYDPIAIDRAALRALGFNNPDQFMAPASAQAQPPPELLEAQAEMRQGDIVAQAQATSAQARLMDAQTKRQVETAKLGLQQGNQGGGPSESDLQIKAAQVAMDHQRAQAENANRAADRAAKVEVERMRLEANGQQAHHDRVNDQLLAAQAGQQAEADRRVDLGKFAFDKLTQPVAQPAPKGRKK